VRSAHLRAGRGETRNGGLTSRVVRDGAAALAIVTSSRERAANGNRPRLKLTKLR